jgi:hypothetical protein
MTFGNITMARVAALMAVLVLPIAGCATLQEVAALRAVQFDLDRVSAAQLAGVDLQRVQRFEDLTATDVARIGTALARGEMPFQFNLHVAAHNPQDNRVQARLVHMDWTLFLQNREAVSGTFDQNVLLPLGQTVDIPLSMRVDLFQFVGRNARDAVELALNLIGAGGEPKQLSLQAQPTIDTAIGPIRYPRPIMIVDRQVGR